MVRQFSRSAMREVAVCRTGDWWPSSRPNVKALDSFAQCGDTSGTLVSQGEWQTEGVLLGGQAHE